MPPKKSPANRTASSRRVKSGPAPLIFLSHDSRDAAVAGKFADLLRALSANELEVFRSSDRTGRDGIPFGEDWYREVFGALKKSAAVVCLLTPRSVDRPWILYEAGIAQGAARSPKVHGLTLGVESRRATRGPFGRFQNSDGSVDSTTALVQQLLGLVPGLTPDPAAVRTQVEAFVRDATTLATEPLRPKYDLFLATPMAALDDEAAYARQREDVATVSAAFQDACGFKSIFFAGKNIATIAEFDPENLSLDEDLSALESSRYFALMLPKKLPSSALFEAGIALALRKPSAYFVTSRDVLPFLMKQVDATPRAATRIFVENTASEIAKLIRKSGLRVFGESPTDAPPGT
ncbi:MAG: toll/interleukin-1 receptor domain-containing protein [Verrucomicrobiota bacterium]